MNLAKLRYPPDPAKVRIATLDDLAREIHLAPLGRTSFVGIPWRGRMLRWADLIDAYRAEMHAAGRGAEADALLLREYERRCVA